MFIKKISHYSENDDGINIEYDKNDDHDGYDNDNDDEEEKDEYHHHGNDD